MALFVSYSLTAILNCPIGWETAQSGNTAHTLFLVCGRAGGGHSVWSAPDWARSVPSLTPTCQPCSGHAQCPHSSPPLLLTTQVLQKQPTTPARLRDDTWNLSMEISYDHDYKILYFSCKHVQIHKQRQKHTMWQNVARTNVINNSLSTTLSAIPPDLERGIC